MDKYVPAEQRQKGIALAARMAQARTPVPPAP
jgi:hypothetical protein